ncbi:hypothetical protein DMP16_09010, partial [Sulfolobus sp. B1]|uniref:hypothetical protein n=1 Tax=Sulfolobus sp. B1 TaxID=2200888 RepID=UPI001C8F8322
MDLISHFSPSFHIPTLKKSSLLEMKIILPSSPTQLLLAGYSSELGNEIIFSLTFLFKSNMIKS